MTSTIEQCECVYTRHGVKLCDACKAHHAQALAEHAAQMRERDADYRVITTTGETAR